MVKKPLSNEQESLFRHPEKLSEHSIANPIKVVGRQIHKYNLSDFSYQNLLFENSDIHTFRLNKTTLTNVAFKKGSLTGIFFNDANMVSVVFEDLEIIDGTFIGTIFGDVTFKNCILHEPAFNGAKGNIRFVNSTLNAPDFYESQTHLTFDNTTITNQGNPREEMFRAQKGSSITMTDSHLYGAVVGGTLTTFKVSGGSVLDSAIGNSINEVIFDHAKLDLTLGNAKISTLNVSHSELLKLSFGKAVIQNIHISDCKNSQLISSIDAKFDSFLLSDCNLALFEPLGASGNQLSIRSSTIHDSDMEGINVKELFLKDIVLTNTNIQNATAGKVVSENVTLAPGGELTDIGSNIRLH